MDTNKHARMKIFIAIPTANSIHHTVVGVLCQILLQGKHDITTYISAMKDIGAHRNVVVKAFLQSDCDYLMMIDSDNPPPPTVLDLMALDKDVISCPTPINMNWMRGVNNYFWNVFDMNGQPTKNKGEGLEKVEKVGTGCILIKRHVLEKIENPFTTVRGEDDNRTVGTDIAFCKKCKKEGIDIHVHWDYICSHFKEMDLLTLINNQSI